MDQMASRERLLTPRFLLVYFVTGLCASIASSWFTHDPSVGASGAILMTRLLHELERRDLRYGLETMCCGGGLGTATIIDREVE